MNPESSLKLLPRPGRTTLGFQGAKFALRHSGGEENCCQSQKTLLGKINCEKGKASGRSIAVGMNKSRYDVQSSVLLNFP